MASSPHSGTLAIIFVFLTNKDRVTQEGKRPHATGQRLGRGGKSVPVGPGLCPLQLPCQTSVLPAAASGRMGATRLSRGGHRGHRPDRDSSVDRLQVCGDLSLCQESRVSHQHCPMLPQHHRAYQCPSSLTSTVTPQGVTLLPHPCLPQHYSIPTHL